MLPITSKQVDSILKSYDIGSLKSFKPLSGGVENTNLEVFTDKGHYVVRIHQDHKGLRTKEYVSFELRLLDFLKKSGYPVPRVMAAKDGSVLFDFKGTHGVIFSFEDGVHIPPKSDWQAREVGKVLGLFHHLVAGFCIPLPKRRKLVTLGCIKDAVSEHICGLEGLDRVLADRVRRYVERLHYSIPRRIPSGCIHLDLHELNVLFVGKRISAVLDWDDSTKGPYIFDLAVALEAWCFVGRKLDMSNVSSMISGYESQRRLSDLERGSLYKSIFPVILYHCAYLLQPRFINKGEVVGTIGFHMDFLDALAELGEKEFCKSAFKKI